LDWNRRGSSHCTTQERGGRGTQAKEKWGSDHQLLSGAGEMCPHSAPTYCPFTKVDNWASPALTRISNQKKKKVWLM